MLAPIASFSVGDIAGKAVLVDLLERERCGDDAAVELGDRDLIGRVERGDALVGCGPLLAAGRQAERLQHGDVQSRHPLDVPGLVVATGARARRRGAARGQDRDDQRVEGAEGVVEVIRRGPEGRAEDRDADRLPAPRKGHFVDGVGEGVREAGVARRFMRSVVEDTDAHLLLG
jgi:hypothetical protein